MNRWIQTFWAAWNVMISIYLLFVLREVMWAMFAFALAFAFLIAALHYWTQHRARQPKFTNGR